ncbi:MAG TPA: hypothetical protein VKW77_02375, partial [Acidimicrobiales bacterium]|nr:hypothetical protein [Acidimicrobiales bacterium]
RHLDRMAPVELTAETAALLAAALRGRPLLAAAVWSAGTGRALRRLAGTPIRPWRAIAWQLAGPWWAVLGLARATTTVVLPGAAALALAASGRRRRWAVAFLALPGLVEWWQRRPDIDPLRWSAACLVDDLCYGAGVWVGCARSRTARPLVPALRPGWLRPTRRRGMPPAPARR